MITSLHDDGCGTVAVQHIDETQARQTVTRQKNEGCQ